MEIQVGEYVRTEKGYIGKVIEFDKSVDCYTVEDNEQNHWVEPIFIVKHSFNLIDLIEVGDYVNGEKVTDTWNGNRIETHRSNFHEEDIKSIVTKERFESIKYEV